MTKENQKKKDEEKPKPEKAKAETKEEDVKIFKAKAMVDGDLRMPSALRKKIKWLNGHMDVTFTIVALGTNSITLEISKAT